MDGDRSTSGGDEVASVASALFVNASDPSSRPEPRVPAAKPAGTTSHPGTSQKRSASAKPGEGKRGSAKTTRPHKPAEAKRVAAGGSVSKSTSQTKKAEKPMAKTSSKKSGGMNKSAEIRKVAAAMKSKGVKPRPSVIVAELKAKGVAVAPAQVSTILKKMGFRPLRKRTKRGAPAAAGASAKVANAPSKAAPKSSSISVDDLIAAKKMAGSLGGTEKALAALSALKRFEE